MRIIGVPFNSSGHPGGVAHAPAALREAGIVPALQQRSGRTLSDGIVDVGDVDVGVGSAERDPRSGLRSLHALTTTTASVRAAVADSLGKTQLPLVLGGDCAVLLGCLRGAADAVGEIGLLFLDGHEDAWPPLRSTTGEAADCELGLALGRHRESLPAPLTESLPTLDPRTVVALGPRDADELAEHAVPSLGTDVALHPAATLGGHFDADACAATTRILRQVQRWWLHLDLDVLSTTALPAVDYPQQGGLNWSDLHALTVSALRAPGCVGITVCIYNPDLDLDRRHAARIVDFLAHTLPRLSPPGVRP